jgi:hypothetical protein
MRLGSSVIAAVVLILPIYGQKTASDKQHDQKATETQQKELPRPASVADINKPAANAQEQWHTDQPDGYFDTLFSPNNIPNVALALVGIGGIIVAVRTLNWLKTQTRAIEKQADLMERQAKESRESAANDIAIAQKAAEAAQASVSLMKQQAELMADTAKRQLRAYVCLSEALVKFTSEGQVEAQMYFRNGGQTPAYDVHSWCHPLVDSYPLGYTLEQPPPEMPMAVGVIPSQEKHFMVAPPLALPPQIIAGLSMRDRAFYVHGEVNYRDIFGDRHVLKYRLVYGGPAGTRTHLDAKGNTVGFLSMDREGNEEA